MNVRNVHVRRLASPPDAVGRLVDALASADDRLWPRDRWPAMRFDRPLGVGAVGGHGPVRYTVVAYEPGRRVDFRFSAPRGFVGTHRYEVVAADRGCALRHVLEIDAVGPARLTWPLVFRPLHDALIEDSLARAGESLGEPTTPARWPLVVRLLRAAVGPLVRASAPRGARGRWIGRWLCGVGVLHSAFGIAVFREPLAGMVADGGWNAMGGDPARQLAVWFLVAGVSLLLVGVIVDAAERDGRALPPAFAWGLLALCVTGIVVGPRTGFWLVLPAAVALVVRARGRPARIR